MNTRTYRIELDRPVTGVAIPVSSIRTERSVGTGEFLDLPLLADWCLDAGLSLIQILPVNDTGTLTSPYSAVSAFAMNPIYTRLEAVPGSDEWQDEIDAFKQEAETRRELDYERVLGFKLDVLYRTYKATQSKQSGHDLDSWIEHNPWVKPYAVYKCLKDRHEQKSWVDWPEFRDPTISEIDQLWDELHEYVRFYSWVQMHLDRQFQDAAAQLRSKGVYLKGDIPILMSVDSCDVWAHRRLFNLEYGAGAPPDMFTKIGQTWGFPIYRWDALEADDYSWWTDRLRVAARYYDAFRIDHVIGFFRIWSQPSHERTAVLGHYEPSPNLTVESVAEAGFSDKELDRLTKAWITAQEAAEALGDDAGRVLQTYFEVDGEDDEVHFLGPAIASEHRIEALDEPQHVIALLIDCHRDRTFVPGDDGIVYPSWYWRDSKGAQSLTKQSTERLDRLVKTFEGEARPMWMALGRRNLIAVSEATDMLPCAEDLGAVPEGLREVLSELGILSLKIERWEVDEDGALIHPSEFPHLSVSTPSVHDLATLRVWWEESDEHLAFYEDLELDDDCPPYLTVEVARAAIERSLFSGSAIAVFQIQDLFSLTYDLRIDPPASERINVPGTVGDHNWLYRIPVTIEYLQTHPLGPEIKLLIKENRPEKPSPQNR
jgi:4-alpha-glucanotransferase